jgi:condensin complex subunit 3
MLAHEQIPEILIEWCLDVLSNILPTERELIRVVVEVVLDLRDEDDRNDILGGIDPNVQNLYFVVFGFWLMEFPF